MTRHFVLPFVNGIFSSKSRNRRLQCHDWWKKLFDYPIRKKLKIHENSRNFATDEEDDCTKIGFPLMKNVFKLLAKTDTMIPLWLTASA